MAGDFVNEYSVRDCRESLCAFTLVQTERLPELTLKVVSTSLLYIIFSLVYLNLLYFELSFCDIAVDNEISHKEIIVGLGGYSASKNINVDTRDLM